MMQDPYETLGIGKDATPAEIKKARRQHANRLHPDRKPDNEKVEAGKQLAIINNAANLLLDPKKREHYDKTGKEQKESSAFAEFRNLVAILVDTDNDGQDLVDVGKATVTASIELFRKNIAQRRARIKKLEKKKGRFVTGKKHNLFENVIDDKISDALEYIEQQQKEIDKAKEVLEYLAAYEDSQAAFFATFTEYKFDTPVTFGIDPGYDPTKKEGNA